MRVCQFQHAPEDNCTPWHFLVPPESELLRRVPVNSIAPLMSVWEPPRYEVVQGEATPDLFFCSLSDWAVTKSVIEAISWKTAGDVEFLPIDCDYEEPLFLLHVLPTVELGPKAKAERNKGSRNITSIYKHDFDVETIAQCKSLFRILQTPGSFAANAGLARREIFAVGDFADFLNDSGLQGVDLVTVFDSGV